MFHRLPHRKASSWSINSIWSSLSDDDEIGREDPSAAAAAAAAAVAPPQSEESGHGASSLRGFARSRQSSTCSVRSCGGMSADETKELWKCMLELQQRYGCYNSTRMDLAMDAGDEAVDLMPNPFILDTLNDSVVELPDEGWEMLYRYWRHNDAPAAK